jgi:hypothetical protein
LAQPGIVSDFSAVVFARGSAAQSTDHGRVYLTRLQAHVLQAQPRDVVHELQPVSWWELLSAGWVSVPCHETPVTKSSRYRERRGGRCAADR